MKWKTRMNDVVTNTFTAMKNFVVLMDKYEFYS